MKLLIAFAVGAVAGGIAAWFTAIWALYQVPAVRRTDDVSGTISSPDGQWTFTGAHLVKEA